MSLFISYDDYEEGRLVIIILTTQKCFAPDCESRKWQCFIKTSPGQLALMPWLRKGGVVVTINNHNPTESTEKGSF